MNGGGGQASWKFSAEWAITRMAGATRRKVRKAGQVKRCTLRAHQADGVPNTTNQKHYLICLLHLLCSEQSQALNNKLKNLHKI